VCHNLLNLVITLLFREQQAHTVCSSQRYYRGAQKSFNWLVKGTLKYVRNFFITYRVFKNFSKWDLPCWVHNSQRCETVLQIWLAGLNLNIPVTTREYFRLTYFWATLYTKRAKWYDVDSGRTSSAPERMNGSWPSDHLVTSIKFGDVRIHIDFISSLWEILEFVECLMIAFLRTTNCCTYA
jgi:hypothetical protein